MAWKRLFGKREPESSPDSASALEGGAAENAVPPPAPGPGAVARPLARHPAAGSRRVRVFVSSTFRDMCDERDELMSHAWPELRRLCRERLVEFVEVDLRWGISEEQATRQETLKLCLDEVRACRPFFLGLLGERYGWVPGSEAFTADLEEEEPWVGLLRDRSVTELEILHGVLNNPEMAGRAFFYFRDPTYSEGRGPDFQAETPQAAERQAALKERVRGVCRERGILLREGYAGPAVLAEMVREDLRGAIEAEYPAESVPDALDAESREHEAYAEMRRRVYIGRPEYAEALDRHALGRGGPLAVVGESGGGKSALLANWVGNWRRAHAGDFLFQHYIGATPGSASHWGLLSRLLAQIKRWTGDPAEVPAKREELLRDLPAWLGKLRAWAERSGARAVVVLDGLNQLEEGEGGRGLGWLPGEPFGGALRLIVSTLPGGALEAVERRGWPALRVEPLDDAERREMAAAYLARFGKQLDTRRLGRLAGAPAAGNPLYLKLLLDELRVTGTHERLDERLDGYLAAESIPALLDTILARWEGAYERYRPGLVGESLALLWAARRGLSEPELLVLLRPAADTQAELRQLPAAVWAPLRAALDESLVDRGGILGLAHEHLRAAVEARYAAGDERQRALRMRLAGYFDKQPVSARSCDELPWLLRQAGERDSLEYFLMDAEPAFEILKRDRQELLGYWLWLDDLEAMGPFYQFAFERWEGVPGLGLGAPPERAAILANELAVFLEHAGQYKHAEVLQRRALAIQQEALGGRNAEMATSLGNLGILLLDRGDLAGARTYLEQALAIRQEVLGERHPQVALSLNGLAGLLHEMGDLAGARTYYRQALAIYEQALGERHPNTVLCLNNLGALLRDLGDLAGARPYLERVLSIRREVLGEGHIDTAASLDNLGGLLQDMGDLAGARPYYERALSIRKEALGERHPATAGSLNNLGTLLQKARDPAGARANLEQALAIQRGALGERHPQVALSLSNLGVLFQEMGDLEDARRYHEQALSIRREVLGERHPATAQSLNNLGLVLKASRDLAGARSCYDRALSIQREALGERHPDIPTTLDNLGLLARVSGDPAGARAYLEQALAIRREVLGERHPDTAKSLSNLGDLAEATGDLAGARTYHQQALAIRREVLGERHLDTALSLTKLALALMASGDRAGARPLLEQDLAIRRAVLGEHHPETALSLIHLGMLLKALGDLAGARSCYDRALAIQREALGERHPDTVRSLDGLGDVLFALRDAKGALDSYQRVLEIRRNTLGDNHPDTAMSLNNLGKVMAAIGDPARARGLFALALKILEPALGPNHPNTRKVRENLVRLGPPGGP